MEFRPCIDIHNGKVKQIVGASLVDASNLALENFVSERDADFFANLYKERGITGGHVIMLNHKESEYFGATKQQALKALAAYPGGLQIGGGIDADNASEYIEAGASHVIVTSYVFSDGQINYDNLANLVDAVGPNHIVLDLSCRKKDDSYYVVTDRWQKFTNAVVSVELLEGLSKYCDEFLIHAADVEGKQQGIDADLVAMLSKFIARPITYAGGIHTYEDIQTIRDASDNRMNVTIGSALDLFGGDMEFERVVEMINE